MRFDRLIPFARFKALSAVCEQSGPFLWGVHREQCFYTVKGLSAKEPGKKSDPHVLLWLHPPHMFMKIRIMWNLVCPSHWIQIWNFIIKMLDALHIFFFTLSALWWDCSWKGGTCVMSTYLAIIYFSVCSNDNRDDCSWINRLNFREARVHISNPLLAAFYNKNVRRKSVAS